MVDISSLPPRELLVLHARLSDELRDRGIIRSYNNPTGDLAEHLFCKAFGWKQNGNSKANIDAIGPDGRSYQIKARRVTRFNKSRQLSAIRDLDGAKFDLLAGVLFSESYDIFRAALIPHAIVVAHASYVGRTNSHRFLLRDEIGSCLESPMSLPNCAPCIYRISSRYNLSERTAPKRVDSRYRAQLHAIIRRESCPGACYSVTACDTSIDT